VSGLLGIGGFEGSVLVQLVQLAIANIADNAPSDIAAERNAIAEAIYCNELDETDTADAFNAIGLDAIASAALADAWASIQSGRIGTLAFLGSLDDTQDCSLFVCPDSCTLYDFTASDGGWYALAGVGSTYVSGSGWQRGTGSQQSRTAIIIDTDPTVTIATISVTLSVSMDGTRRDAQLYKGAALDLDQTISVGSATTFTYTVNTNATRFMVYLRNDPSGSGKPVPGYITSVEVCTQ